MNAVISARFMAAITDFIRLCPWRLCLFPCHGSFILTLRLPPLFFFDVAADG